jgi:hypothetical protein
MLGEEANAAGSIHLQSHTSALGVEPNGTQDITRLDRSANDFRFSPETEDSLLAQAGELAGCCHRQRHQQEIHFRIRANLKFQVINTCFQIIDASPFER